MASSTSLRAPVGKPPSHSGNTNRSLRTMSLVLLLVFGLASAALIHVALRQNAQAAEQSRFYVEKVLEARQRQLETTLADYAFWGDAYKHLHATLDLEWAYERRNVGSSLYETFGYEGVFLVGPDDYTRYSVTDGLLDEIDVSIWTGHDLSALLAKARILAADEEVVAGFLTIDSQPALIAVAALSNDSDPTVPLIPGPESVFVWVDRLHPEKLLALGEDFGISALRTSHVENPHSSKLTVETFDGESLWLEWTSPRPGDNLLKFFLPLLLLASVVLVIIIRLNLRNALRTAKAIDAGYLAAQAYQAKLTFHAQHDPLTGLPNRSLLQDRLEQAQQSVLAEGKNLAVMLIDLDGFKPINDTYGHHYGDKVLIDVARRLESVVGPGDTVARLGGDEFVLLMLTDRHRSHFEVLANNALASVAAPYSVEGHEFHITGSAGLAISSPDIDQVQRLIQQADMAMYAAKADGRNICQWFTSSLDRQASEKLNLRNDLQTALDRDQFELYYQPQICAQSMRVLGVEALLRWHHPIRGMVSPAEFIPLAEETGQIIPMSRWVLNAACAQLRQLTLEGHHTLTMAVNISSMHLMRRDFIEDVQHALSITGVAAERLELELTESVLLRQVEQATATLKALRELGVKIAIDDFGTGFSNLGYLRRLPVQCIKIDRSFIAELETSPQDAAIVEGILWLAHKLNLRVIAEGVETAAQSAFLARYHCDGFQGYFFARPMSIELLRAFLGEADGRRTSEGRPAIIPAE